MLESQKTSPVVELKKAAASTFAALTIGSSILSSPIVADAIEPFAFSSTNVVAEKVIRQGLYQDYEVDIVQSVDDASSTFKSAKETKTKKGESTDQVLNISWVLDLKTLPFRTFQESTLLS